LIDLKEQPQPKTEAEAPRLDTKPVYAVYGDQQLCPPHGAQWDPNQGAADTAGD
jgi:hypothetical protein